MSEDKRSSLLSFYEKVGMACAVIDITTGFISQPSRWLAYHYGVSRSPHALQTVRFPMKRGIPLLMICVASSIPVAADVLYWNGGDISATPANGGSGVWNETNAWRAGSASGAQTTWSAGAGGTNDAILAGASGTITLGSSGNDDFIGGNITVLTTGYGITSSNGNRNLVFAGTLSLASDVALTFGMNNANPEWSVGSINFATGSSLVIQGNANPGNSNRLNLSAAGTIAGGTMTLAGTAAGPTGLVATVSGVILNTDILNNSLTSATMLGATNGHSLDYGGVLRGSAHLQISAGQSGGAGIVTLNQKNLFGGNTYLNHVTGGVLRVGITDALPAGTTVFFAQSAGGGAVSTGGTLDLNGRDQTVAALDGVGRGVVNTTSSMSVLTIGKETGVHTFRGVIGIPSITTNLTSPSNQISLIKTGQGTQVLSGSNTYAGSTTVEEGLLVIDGGTSAASAVWVKSGGKLAGSGTVGGATTIQSGGKHSAGPAAGVGAQIFSNGVNYQAGSIFEWDLGGESTTTGFDTVTVSSGTLTGSGEFRVVTDLDFGAASGFWNQQRVWTTIFSGSGTLSGWLEQAATVYDTQGVARNTSSFGSFTISGTTLTWNAVPEPSNLLIGALIGFGITRRGRRME
jgi:autotransporter-associated beta strand protein